MPNYQACGVYIVTNIYHTVLYVGMSTQLPRRIWTHKQKLIESFTKRYNVTKLVYFESAPDKWSALTREKQIKKYSRFKKIQLILSINPNWDDLSECIGL